MFLWCDRLESVGYPCVITRYILDIAMYKAVINYRTAKYSAAFAKFDSIMGIAKEYLLPRLTIKGAPEKLSMEQVVSQSIQV